MDATPTTSLYQRLYVVFPSLNIWQSKTIAEQMKMKKTIMDEDRELKKSMDESISLLNQLSSFKNERVVCLDSIKNFRNRVYEVSSKLKSNRYDEIFHLDHACVVEAQIYQDYTLLGRMDANPTAEALASLQRPVMCPSGCVFAPTTPEYLKIYEKFKVSKFWQQSKDDRMWSLLRFQGMLYGIAQGDHELSYRRAEAERISAALRERMPRLMDSNPIADWRTESMWLHYRANTILIEIEINCAKAIEALIAIGREIIS